MITDRKLPAEFTRKLELLEESYLTDTDPIRQSGFGGGPGRWRAEREPILDAVESDGDFLDIGCANGYLLECLIRWGKERGVTLVPHGLDRGRGLIELARKRLPEFKENFYVGNAWEWMSPGMLRYVYTLCDCVPSEYLEEYIHRLRARTVAPGGRLIVGAYGSRSEAKPPLDVAAFLQSSGFEVVGVAEGSNPPVAKFAWIDK